MEIQDTLHEPPKAVVNMKKAIHVGMGCSLVFYMCVSVLGYLALGNAVPGDILTGFTEPSFVVTAANAMVLIHMLPAYQVFSQPLFHGMEQFLTEHVPNVSRMPPLVLRIVVRSLYVALTTTVAVVMPFFTDIIGLVGALVFWPIAVHFPVRMYLKVYNAKGMVAGLLQGMQVVAAVTSFLAAIGAVWNISQHVERFTFSWLG
jgi:amino acid permease